MYKSVHNMADERTSLIDYDTLLVPWIDKYFVGSIGLIIFPRN